MAGSKNLKNRIKSTKNIKQVTKAMEAVSAVKMRRSQQFALRARPYALAALEILRGVEPAINGDLSELSPLLSKRPVANSCLVIITSDKGLAGSFNTSVIRKAEKMVKDLYVMPAHAGQAGSDKNVSLVAIGKKGRDYFKRRGANIVAEYVDTGDFGEIEETRHISDFLIKIFTEKQVDEIVLVYTNFLSALKQEVVTRSLLPFDEKSLTEIVDSVIPLRGRYANMPHILGNMKTPTARNFLFEPSPKEVLSELLPDLLAVEIFHAILEANASEHSSRMVAMKSASENASELINDLNIKYNKARQALITKELAEITGGAAALEE